MSRTVTLDGQAYFEVAQSTNVPFFVRTGTVVTQVLGTSFLVRYYANDGPAHIAVAAGKVGVLSTIPTRWSALSPVVLTAGHVADVTDSMVNESAVKDLMAETDWLRGQLMFRHAPVREVLRTLSRWYGYQFRCADSTLAQENVTLAVSTHSSAEALATLERILSVHLTVVGDTVTLMPHANQRETRPLHKQEYNVWIPTREVGR
jgi:ferric-dicitrate binding protein FerR (iron transport regulator)